MIKKQLPNLNSRISAKTILGFIAASILVFFLSVSVINVSQKYFRIKKEANSLKVQQLDLKEKDRKLDVTNQYLATPEGKERELRDKFNVVKPGEGMIVITETKTDSKILENRKSGISKWWSNLLEGLGIKKG